MNEFGDYAWMDGLHSDTNIFSVCLYQILDFREVHPSVYSIPFYSICRAVSLSLSLSLIRSLLSIDPSMTSEERRGGREGGRGEGVAAEKISVLVIFGNFFVVIGLYYIGRYDRSFFSNFFF